MPKRRSRCIVRSGLGRRVQGCRHCSQAADMEQDLMAKAALHPASAPIGITSLWYRHLASECQLFTFTLFAVEGAFETVAGLSKYMLVLSW